MAFLSRIKIFLRNNYIAYFLNGGGKSKYWERTYNKVVSQYSPSAQQSNEEKAVIVMVDGKSGPQNGLADRLRGILSVYSICREEGIPFRIYWTYPFPLSDYLQPNNYNWEIDEESVSNSLENSQITIRFVLGNVLFENWIDKRYIRKAVETQTKAQLHIYTNSIFSQQGFHLYFDELFKPSQYLEDAIKENFRKIGTQYYSATFRFQELLGDFKESKSCTTLPTAQKDLLISECLNQLQSFVFSIPEEYNVLVTSDSVTFLDEAKIINRVFIIPGKVNHTHFVAEGRLPFLKSYVDFFLIKNAESVHLFKNKLMYESGFPKLAALCGNRPFVLHKF